MINWHRSTCAGPKITFLDDTGPPSCLNCFEAGVIDEASSASAARKPPETPQRSGFELCWPASLPFIEDVPDNDGSTVQSKPASSAAIISSGVVAAGETPAATLYEPLYARKIRILRLLPGKYHDPIRCKIQTVDLKSRPEYEALSYTWADSTGDTSLSQSIYVGDRYDILPITVNCANALRRLRFPYRSRALWVDAICIDQNNVQERSHQVGIMQYIYATAERVLIYLGEDEEDPDPATCVPWQYGNRGNTLELSTDLRKQPYFTRVWVIQEIASARFAWVLLGSRGARWADFLKPPVIGDASHRSLSIKNYDLLKSRHPWLQLVAQPRHRNLNELWGLISATAQCQASDPRDKIFALLGLFVGSNDAGLVPDYSISFSQVLCGLTALIFVQYPDLWPQMFATIEPCSLRGLPTWAVDWSNPTATQRDFLESHLLVSASSGGNSRDSDNNTSARFCSDGSLVVKGAPLSNLLDCTLTTQPEDGPRVIQDISYEPDAPTSVRIKRIETKRWVDKSDKIYTIAGLRNEFLILRPLEFTNKQSFVGICRKFPIRCYSGLVNLLEPKTALLFSMWNEVLGHRTEDWLVTRAWNDMRNVCDLIQQHWKLEKDSLPRLRKALEQERHRRDHLREDYTKPYLEDIYTFRLMSDMGVDLADFLLPVCWYYEKSKGQSDERIPRNHPDSEHGLHWHSGYSNQYSADGFWRRLGRVLRSRVTCLASDYESAASLLWRLTGQKLSLKHTQFQELMRIYYKGLAPEDSFEDSALHRLSLKERYCDFGESDFGESVSEESSFEKPASIELGFEQRIKTDIEFLAWVKSSMELGPFGPASYWSSVVYLTRSEATSTEIFCEVWEGLFWRPETASPNEPLPKIFERDLEREGIRTVNFDEEVEVGKWKFTASFEEKAWNMLLELVRETEKHLLPLEVAFLEGQSAATCANKTEEMKLEDVYIV